MCLNTCNFFGNSKDLVTCECLRIHFNHQPCMADFNPKQFVLAMRAFAQKIVNHKYDTEDEGLLFSVITLALYLNSLSFEEE